METPSDVMRRIEQIKSLPGQFAEQQLIAIGEARFDALRSLEDIPEPPLKPEQRDIAAYAIRALQLLDDKYHVIAGTPRYYQEND